MARKTRRHSMLVLPSRFVLVRFGQIFLITCLAALLVLSRSGNPMVQDVRMRLADVLMPVLTVVSAPVKALHGVTSGVHGWAATYHDNQKLKTENRDLLQWQALAKDMQVENEKLRGLLNVAPRRGSKFTTAQIVSGHGSAFTSAAIINAGADDGIGVNQAVISERGLVGRVIEAGNRTAQVRLLTDMNSRIPVMNERTREKMILIGKGAALPALSYVATDSGIRKGDRIITSGDGGVFPKNIAVGVVRDAGKSAMQVELFANMSDIEYVSIVQNQ